MSGDYLDRLSAALHVRGRARARFLAECRDHLDDLRDHLGADAAESAFGDPVAVAAAFDAAVATRRAVLATAWSTVGVVAVGGSTLALITAADPTAHAVRVWSILFFLCAQVSGTSALLAVLHALRLRHQIVAANDVALLCRRAAVALVAAALTIFAAGGSLPGRADARTLLAGPLVAVAAGAAVLRAWRLTRRLHGARTPTDRSPFADLRALTRAALPAPRLPVVVLMAAAGAFVRDHGEHGATFASSLVVGAVEAALVLGAFIVLRGPLGLRALRIDEPNPGALPRRTV